MFIINELLECNHKNGWTIKAIETSEIWSICNALREEDKREIVKVGDKRTFDACVFDLIMHYNHPIYKIMHNGETIGIGGICKSYDKQKGIIWLCFTKDYEKHKLSFLLFSKRFKDKLIKAYGCLSNVVWLGNLSHVEYLTWLGAKWTPLTEEFAIFELK